MLAWLYDVTVSPKIEARHRRKQALKKVRAQEQEYELRWAELMKPQSDKNTTKP